MVKPFSLFILIGSISYRNECVKKKTVLVILQVKNLVKKKKKFEKPINNNFQVLVFYGLLYSIAKQNLIRYLNFSFYFRNWKKKE